jgi:hypothetical protein
MVGQGARLTGGPRYDIEAASASVERSGWSAPRVAKTGAAITGGTTVRTAARTARETAQHSRSPAAMRTAPAAIAARCAASIAAAGGEADDP